MAGWQVVLFMLLTVVFNAQATNSRPRSRIIRRQISMTDSMFSFFRDMEKRMEVVEKITNNVTCTEQKLADLEAGRLSAIKDGLENLEAKTHNDTEPRLASLEDRMEDLRAMVSELGSRERNDTEKTLEDGERPERKTTGQGPASTACRCEHLYQFPTAESPLLRPDLQRLSKIESELSCMQRFLSAGSRSNNDQGKEGGAPRTTPAASVPTEGRLREMMVELLNATESKMMSVLTQRLSPPTPTDAPSPPEVRKQSCEEYLTSGHYESGIYTLHLSDNRPPIQVFCDMDSAGGGWVVIQRRLDGSENFYRNWTDYERGFGNLSSEFWLGNDKIHRLTTSRRSTLLVVMEDWEGNTAQAWYSRFSVDSAISMYRLTVDGYSGNAGDNFTYTSGHAFSTPDRDNDAVNSYNCAQDYKGAWWHKDCTWVNLNALYGTKESSGISYIYWSHRRQGKVLKSVQMMVK